MTPLERAARALYQSAPHDFDPNQIGEDATWPDLVDQVRAVLQAIREPSARMIADGEAWQTHCTDVDSLFSEMIKAALEEG